MLTDKKKAYADARISGLNVKDSALKAGCPAQSAKQAGYRLERDTDVQIYWESLNFIPDTPRGRKPRKKVGQAKAKAKPPKQSETLKAKEPEPQSDWDHTDDPLEVLERLMNADTSDDKLKADCAKAMLPYRYIRESSKQAPKVPPAGKKQQAQEAAEGAAAPGKGKFTPRVVN